METTNVMRQWSKWALVLLFGTLWFITISWIAAAFYRNLSKATFALPFSQAWLWMILISSVAFLIGSLATFGLKKFRWSGNYQLIWWLAFFCHAILIDVYLIHKLVHNQTEFSIILTSSVLIIINLMMIFEHRFKYYLKNWNQEEYRDNLKQELRAEIKIVENLLIYSRFLKTSEITSFNLFHLQILVGLLNAKSFAQLFPQNAVPSEPVNGSNHDQNRVGCFEIFDKYQHELQTTLLFVAFRFRQTKMHHYRLNKNWKEWDNHYQVNLEKCRKIRNFFKLLVCRSNQLELTKVWQWIHLIESNIYSNLPAKPAQF